MPAIIGEKKPFIHNLLLIEGITRVGKFLLANVVAGFKDIEPVQYDGLFEDIPYLVRYRLLHPRVAQLIVQNEMDLIAYETAIGRRLNHRQFDKSSIFNVPHPEQFLKRSTEENIEKLIHAYYHHQRYSVFILHEVMPNISFFMTTFPNLKMISLQRSPVELVHSWFKRGHGKRWGNDPLLFQIPFTSAEGPIPWFAYEWKDEYYASTEIDRVIRSILTLHKFSVQSYKRLPTKQKQQILFVHFDDLLQDPQAEIKKIGHFLNRKTLPAMKDILIREQLPNLQMLQDSNRKLEEIQQLATPKLFSKLMRLEKKYWQRTVFPDD